MRGNHRNPRPRGRQERWRGGRRAAGARRAKGRPGGPGRRRAGPVRGDGGRWSRSTRSRRWSG